MLARALRLAATLLPTLLIVLLVTLAVAPARAANLQISPVSISFRGAQGAAGLTLQNFGAQPLHGQVRVYTWDQKDGEDVLAPAVDVVASPPIIEVAPNGAQTVRLVRLGARAGQTAGNELTYRILIDELPRGGDAPSGVAIRLQYSVPVFVLPADDKAAPRLTWSLLNRDGAWFLRLRNDGKLHAQVGATTLRTPAGKDISVSKGLLGYALSGRSREWKLTPEAAGLLGRPAGPVAVQATVNAQPHEASAGLE